MSQFRRLLTFILIPIIQLGLASVTSGQPRSSNGRQADPPDFYFLPIEKAGCGGFTYADGTLYLFEYNGRQVHEVSKTHQLVPRENVSGWYVVDMDVIDGAPVYCSRDRVFRKVRGKVEVTKIPGTQKLISITSDRNRVYLLDSEPQPTILVLDRRTRRETRRFRYDGRKPIDIVFGDGLLWVLDQGDRCIHRVDMRTGKTTLRLQAGPGVASWTKGLLYRDGELYVHEGDFARLRRVQWKQDGPAVWSWWADIHMDFIQRSANEHASNVSTVDFAVPVPPKRATQFVSSATWSQPPTRVDRDRFGQTLARFRNLRIPPGQKHELRYSMDVRLKAVQYDPPPLPIDELQKIDPAIARMFLASNRPYGMDDPGIVAAAREARADASGREPTDVRSLIENIAEYVIGEMSYVMDDAWNDAAQVLKRGQGSCSEYSFLFSALCRRNGIPTRLVGGVQIGDYLAEHETAGFHRWTEIWYPTIGWIPVDVTKIDGAAGSLDYEFLFGTPGYLVVLSQGDFDEDGLGMNYFIRRSYRGGKRTRSNTVQIRPLQPPNESSVVRLRK